LRLCIIQHWGPHSSEGWPFVSPPPPGPQHARKPTARKTENPCLPMKKGMDGVEERGPVQRSPRVTIATRAPIAAIAAAGPEGGDRGGRGAYGTWRPGRRGMKGRWNNKGGSGAARSFSGPLKQNPWGKFGRNPDCPTNFRAEPSPWASLEFLSALNFILRSTTRLNFAKIFSSISLC